VADTVHCSGCHQVIDVARPPGVAYQITRGPGPDGRDTITITIGQVIVHRCRLCADGEWR